MDHPTNVCLIMAWEPYGAYLFTALLKVSYQVYHPASFLTPEKFKRLGTTYRDVIQNNGPYRLVHMRVKKKISLVLGRWRKIAVLFIIINHPRLAFTAFSSTVWPGTFCVQATLVLLLLSHLWVLLTDLANFSEDGGFLLICFSQSKALNNIRDLKHRRKRRRRRRIVPRVIFLWSDLK